MNETPIDFDLLRKAVCGILRALPDRSVHGPCHWRRVERNALILAKQTGAIVPVLRLFALFHDSQRENDGHDPHHGARGAALVKRLRGKLFHLPDVQFDLLHESCVWQTARHHHEDATFGTCWDTDRLDLCCVGIIPTRNT